MAQLEQAVRLIYLMYTSIEVQKDTPSTLHTGRIQQAGQVMFNALSHRQPAIRESWIKPNWVDPDS
jgi:hypothetical protein